MRLPESSARAARPSRTFAGSLTGFLPRLSFRPRCRLPRCFFPTATASAGGAGFSSGFPGSLLLALCSLLVAGCQSTPVLLRPAQTNVVEVVHTNFVTVVTESRKAELGIRNEPVTNTVYVTNVVAALTTNVVTLVSPPVFYTNVSLSPLAAEVATTAGGLAPVPWGGAAASVGLGLVGSVFALVNERRRRQALGQALTWEQAAGVLVENVESVRKAALQLPGYTAAVDLQVVRNLEAAQRAAGVKNLIHDLVEERTDDTVSVFAKERGFAAGGFVHPAESPNPRNL